MLVLNTLLVIIGKLPHGRSSETPACQCVLAVRGEMLLKMLGIVLQGISACSEYLKVGGASRAMQREPPTACKPPCTPPSSSLELMNGLNTINGTFFSPSLLQALLYLSEDFWECSVCACVCFASEKNSKTESTLVNVRLHVRLWFMYHVLSACLCGCVYEFIASQSRMCVSHVEQDSRSPRPGLRLVQPTQGHVSFLGCETLGVAHERSAPGHLHSQGKIPFFNSGNKQPVE